MKVYANRLAESLSKQLAPIYIVSGDEPLLVQEACDEIRSAAKKAGYLERDLFHAEGNFDWGEISYSLNSMSLFAEKKVLEVRMASAKPGDKGSKALVSIAEEVNEDTLLMLVMPRVDASGQRSKWFKTLEAAAVFVQVWPIEARELPRWLENRFRQAGLRASRDAVRLMAERIEGNLLAAVQEIERLKLIAGDKGEVDAGLVEMSVADSARFDVFNLIDAALIGNSDRVARMMQGLKTEGVEVLFVVNMLARELRSLEGMSEAMARGSSVNDVLKKGRVWDKRKNAVTECLKRNNQASLHQVQFSLGRVDRMVKGIENGDPWRELTTLMLTLSGGLAPGALAV